MNSTQKIQALLKDSATPVWVSRLVKEALEKDCVDAARYLEYVGQLFGERATEILRAGAHGQDMAQSMSEYFDAGMEVRP